MRIFSEMSQNAFVAEVSIDSEIELNPAMNADSGL